MNKARTVPFWVALIAVAIAAGVPSAVIVNQVRLGKLQAGRISGLEAENRLLRSNVDDLTRQLEQVREAAGNLPAQPALPRERRPVSTVRPDDPNALAFTKRELDVANSSIDQLQIHIRELEASIEKLTEENKRILAAESDLKERLAGSTRVLEAVQTELKAKSDRVTQVETTNRLLFDQNRSLSEKTNRLPRLIQDLEDINRRRESYLNNVVRRYREITDQYRAVSARFDRAARETSGGDSAELARIQNTLSLAEEDLRQLSALNTQAVRIGQKIAGK